MPSGNSYHRDVCFCCQWLSGNFEFCALVQQFSLKWIQFRISIEKWLVIFWVQSKGSAASRWPGLDIKSREAWMFAYFCVDKECNCRHQSSLELIKAQFCPFMSMSWSMFSHNPHVHQLTDPGLAPAWDSCGWSKVHALTLVAWKTTWQLFLFQRTQSIWPKHEHQQTSILTFGEPNERLMFPHISLCS